MTLDELLDETNPELVTLLRLRPTQYPQDQKSIQQKPLKSTGTGSESERLRNVRDRLVDAVARGHRRLGEIREDMLRWNELDSADRGQLIDDAEEILHAIESKQRFDDFARWASAKLGEVSHRWSRYLLPFVCISLPVFLAFLYWAFAHVEVKGKDRTFAVIAAACLAAVAALPFLAVIWFLERRRVRRIRKELIREDLLPAAEERGIAIGSFGNAVYNACNRDAEDPGRESLRSFENHLRLLDQVLAENKPTTDSSIS